MFIFLNPANQAFVKRRFLTTELPGVLLNINLAGSF
jgi:hypothetical protein